MVVKMETLGGSLDDVRALCAVVEFGTISAAARALGETKGSVSRRLSRLESRLDVVLLARTPRAVSPTEEGRAFYSNAREALTWLDDATEAARQSQSLPQGHLRLTAPLDLGVDVLPELVARFRALHPLITVELVLSDTALDLASNRIDLALRVPTGGLPDMGYRATLLTTFEVGLYASQTYLATRGTPAQPEQLTAHDLLVVGKFSDSPQLELQTSRGRRKRVVVRPVIHTSDYSSLLRLAIAGSGVAPLPELAAASSADSGALVRVLPEWHTAQVNLHAISLRGTQAPARVRVFMEFLRGELGQKLRR